MTDAAIRGSIGSVAILMRVSARPGVSSMSCDTLFLTPAWDPNAPDTLAGVTERYKVPGTLLAAHGYDIDDPGAGLLVHADMGRSRRKHGSCRRRPTATRRH